MRLIVILLLVILPLTFPLISVAQDQYKWGKPSSKGVDEYVERNEYQFIIDYQNFVTDTLFADPFINTDDLSEYVDYTKGESGNYWYPDNILIDNQTKYLDYEIRNLSESQRSQYVNANKFVRAVVMHELTHCYFYQQMMIARQNNELALEFRQGLRIIPIPNRDYGADFIEEGICEYQTLLMGEIICDEERISVTRNQLRNKPESYEVMYKYGMQFVKPIVDKLGLKAAIYLLVTNKPPNQEEILNPKLYYERLNVN